MTQFLDENGEVFHETGKGRWVSSKKMKMADHWADITVRVDESGEAQTLFPTLESWDAAPTVKHWDKQAEAVLTGPPFGVPTWAKEEEAMIMRKMVKQDEEQRDFITSVKGNEPVVEDEEDAKDDDSDSSTATDTEGESQKTTLDAFDPLPKSTRQLKVSKWKELDKSGGWYPSNGPVRIRLNPYSMEIVKHLIPQKWKRMNKGRREKPDPDWKELPTVTIEFEEGKVALFSSSENTGVQQLVGDDGAQMVSDVRVRWTKDGTVLAVQCRLNRSLLTVQSEYYGDEDTKEDKTIGTISGGAVKIFPAVSTEDVIEMDESVAFAYPAPGLNGAQFPTKLSDEGSRAFRDYFDKAEKWFAWMKHDEVNMMATLHQYENTDYEGEYLKKLDFSEKDARTLGRVNADGQHIKEALFVTVKVLDSTNGFTGNSLVTANQGQIALMFPGDEADLSMGDKWGGPLEIKWDENSSSALLVFKDGGSFPIPSNTEGEIVFKDKTTFGESAEFKGTVLSIKVLEVDNLNQKYASIKEQRRKDNLNDIFTNFQTAMCPVCKIEMAAPCERIDCPMPVETTTISFAYEDENGNIVLIVPKDTSADSLTNLIKITLKEKGDDE